MTEIEYQPEAALRFTSAETSEAAAAVAAAFLEGVEPDEDAGQPVVAMPQAPAPSQPTTEQHEEVEAVAEPEPFDFTQFEPKLSPDLEELLEDETPDFEEQARAELAQQAQYQEDTGEYVEYQDVDQAAKLLAAEKRVAFLEGRLVETNRGKWVRENLNAYPLAATYAKERIEKIEATSRRGFAREAAKINAEVTAIAQPLLADLKTRLAAQGQVVNDQQRQIVQEAWGVPMVEPAAAGSAAERAQKIQSARKTEDLGKVLRAHIETGGNPLL